jgi:hypothetical protein
MKTRRAVLRGGSYLAALALCPCGAHGAEPRAFGCYVAPEDTGPLLSKSTPGEQASPDLKDVQYGSGSQMFDYAMARTLAHLSKVTGTQPAFAFFDESGTKNAYATDYPILQTADGTIVFGRKLIRFLFSTFPDDVGPAITAICAHEFGHIIAYKRLLSKALMPDRSKPFRSEQFADFFAGWYAGRRHLLEPDFPAADFSKVFGSLAGKDRGSHGTAADRMLAVGAGFTVSQDRSLAFNAVLQQGVDYAMGQPET